VAHRSSVTNGIRRGVQSVGPAGRPWARPGVTMIDGAPPTSGACPRVDRLTPRQLEVLALMAAGRSNAAIATILEISEKAVVQHTSQIYDRLDLAADDDSCHRRVVAVVQFLTRAAA
jgi:DNA-binding NarL/FixJ family response regulator